MSDARTTSSRKTYSMERLCFDTCAEENLAVSDAAAHSFRLRWRPSAVPMDRTRISGNSCSPIDHGRRNGAMVETRHCSLTLNGDFFRVSTETLSRVLLVAATGTGSVGTGLSPRCIRERRTRRADLFVQLDPRAPHLREYAASGACLELIKPCAETPQNDRQRAPRASPISLAPPATRPRARDRQTSSLAPHAKP